MTCKGAGDGQAGQVQAMKRENGSNSDAGDGKHEHTSNKTE